MSSLVHAKYDNSNAENQILDPNVFSRPVAVSSDLSSLLAGDVAVYSDPYRGKKTPNVVFGDPSAGDYSVVSGSPTLSLVTDSAGRTALKIVTGVGVNAEISFPNLAGNIFDGETYLLLSGSYADGLGSVSFYATPDADYSVNFTVTTYTPALAPLNTGYEPGGLQTIRLDRANRAVTGTITYPFALGTHKLRITPQGGLSTTVYLYGIGFAAQPSKGRIAVICDDGYDSWFRFGQPIMQSRGIPVTCAVIPVNVNTGGGNLYMRQLQGFIQAGNAVVAHGPNINAGSGNLFTSYTNTADRIADMVAVRKWILDNGLAVKGYESCYVWPQGTWQAAYPDVTLLDAAIEAGFILGRAANGRSLGQYGNFDSLSKYQRLTLPIIGHLWAGTTAAEATNITAIVALIDNAAAQGADITLMLHRVQATSTPDGSMSSVGIRVSDLTTLANAIAAKVTAGTLQALTLPEFGLTKAANFWAR